MIAKVGVVLVAKAYDDNSVHVPHRSKLDDIICSFGFLDHHEETVSLNFIREVIERGCDEGVFQGVTLILLMVIDKDTDYLRRILRKQDSCHVWDISALLQGLLNLSDGCFRDLGGFAVDDIGDSCGAYTQLLCYVRYSYRSVLISFLNH